MKIHGLRFLPIAFCLLGAEGGSCGESAPVAPPVCALPIGETCVSDRQCDDGLFCTGVELCSPGAPGASRCGCIREPAPCVAGDVCAEPSERCYPPACVNPDVDADGSDALGCGGDDCDDGDAARFPGATELCDAANIDEDCNDATPGWRDDDTDGFADAQCCNGSSCGLDCDDANPVVHPGAPDLCDGEDNDCNGAIDDGEVAATYVDSDGDGHGAGPAVYQCPATPGFSLLHNDCDDTSAAIQPGAIRCDPIKAGEYQLCQADGTFMTAYCPLSAACRAQPGGNGICL